MASDYAAIAKDHLRRYGTDTADTVGLLGDMYSERTHFVFELLQNAEDAGATKIRFDLHPNRLEVRHNGRPFDERDVRGVCGVRKGTKAEDRTKIGKFGIGFKSVYNYTASPEIHSGNEHFRIRGYVRPEAVPGRELGWGVTLLVLPFNHATTGPKNAFGEIASCLRSLGVRTLLFLRKIRSIVWSFSTGEEGRYQRNLLDDQPCRRVKLIGLSAGIKITEEWVIFQREVAYDGVPLTVEAGYMLHTPPGGASKELTSPGPFPLVVFFPTEKETHLRFPIQGPYRTTPARDNIIRDDPLNRYLILETAELIVASLPRLRDMNLLTVSALQLLPVRKEDFPDDDPFRPIFDAVQEAFRRHALLPAYDGGYVRSGEVRVARTNLRDLLSAQQLQALYKADRPLHWPIAQITEDQTPDFYRFLRAVLRVEEVTPESLVRQLTGDFLQRQSDEWIARFYTFLDGLPTVARSAVLRTKPILRLEDGRHVAPVGPDGKTNAYLPAPGRSSLPTVRRSLVEHDAAKSFLTRLGIRPPDAVAEALELILPQYAAGDPPDDPRTLCDDAERVLHALELPSPRLEDLKQAVKETPFIRTVNCVGDDPLVDADAFIDEPGFHRPSDVFLRTPDAELFFRGNYVKAVFPHPCYERLGDRVGALGLAREITVRHRPSDYRGYVAVHDDYGLHVRGVARFDPDADVPYLRLAFDSQTSVERGVELAMFVWNRLCIPYSHLIAGVVERSTRQSFSYPEQEKITSPFGRELLESSWLPDREGVLHPPTELSLDDLPKGFIRDDRVAAQLGMRVTPVQELATAAGIDAQLLAFVRQHQDKVALLMRQVAEDQAKAGGKLGTKDGHGCAEVSTGTPSVNFAAELVATFSRAGRDTAPVEFIAPGPAPQPAERRERVARETRELVEMEPAPDERFRIALQRIWEPKNAEIRTYLAEQYAGACQICGATPFPQARSGLPYFTGTHFVSHTTARWLDRPGNALCLCPTCCAKFVFGAVVAEDIVEQIRAYRAEREGGTAPAELRLTLCGEPATIRFTERHLLDLQALLEAGTGSAAGAAPLVAAGI